MPRTTRSSQKLVENTKRADLSVTDTRCEKITHRCGWIKTKPDPLVVTTDEWALFSHIHTNTRTEDKINVKGLSGSPNIQTDHNHSYVSITK